MATQLLGAMLPHPLQQQVVDCREMIVAAALQRLRRGMDSRLAVGCFVCMLRYLMAESAETFAFSVQSPRWSSGGRCPACS